MKRMLMRAICLIVVVALMAGFCVAYAATSEGTEKAERAERAYAQYDFYLALESGGQAKTAPKQKKEAPYSYAYFYLTTITNTTGYPLYINVRDSTGTAIRGDAETIVYGQTTPTYKYVDYLTGHGTINTYYRPSGQTSSSAVFGGYIQGKWRP